MIPLVLLLAQSVAGPSAVTRGEQIFAQNCSVGYCHGVAGAAGRGPRLRGRSFAKEYLYNVTRDGIPNSAMPAWKDRLKDDDIRAVVEYVASLATSTDPAPPANPMPPGIGPAAMPSFKGPAAAARGHELFSDPARANCGFCHAVGGRGIAIGPDLTVSKPAEMLSEIGATHSRHVVTAKLKNGEEFPALLVEQNVQEIRLYDLTLSPPVMRTLLRAEIISLGPNSSWRHSNFVKDYSRAELEEIVVYLRWAASGK
jgi:mono/diheme cytochrome c family protein